METQAVSIAVSNSRKQEQEAFYLFYEAVKIIFCVSTELWQMVSTNQDAQYLSI